MTVEESEVVAQACGGRVRDVEVSELQDPAIRLSSLGFPTSRTKCCRPRRFLIAHER